MYIERTIVDTPRSKAELGLRRLLPRLLRLQQRRHRGLRVKADLPLHQLLDRPLP
jgi:hypothetical protein